MARGTGNDRGSGRQGADRVEDRTRPRQSQRCALMRLSEPAPAKLNLALHVRGKRPDGRHELETIFAFCTDGDILHLEAANRLSLEITGAFAAALAGDGDNLVLTAVAAPAGQSGVTAGAALTLVKKLPVASGIGGGSADAAAG